VDHSNVTGVTAGRYIKDRPLLFRKSTASKGVVNVLEGICGGAVAGIAPDGHTSQRHSAALRQFHFARHISGRRGDQRLFAGT
jgi:hypothetical protein